MKPAFIILTAGISLLITVSCSKQSEKYTDKNGNFSIRFGGEPDTLTQTQSFGFGTFKWKVAEFSTTEGMNNYYSVSYLDLPKRTITSDSLRLLSELFALSQSDYLQLYGENQLSGTLTKTIKGYPGREFVWIIKSENKCFTRRYYLVKNRLYRMEVQYTLKDQHNKEIGAFLNSFKLIKATRNPNPEKTAIKPKKKFYADFPGITKVKFQEVYGAFGPQSLRIEAFESTSNNAPDEYGNIGYSVLTSIIPEELSKQFTEESKKAYLRDNFRNNKMIQSGKIILDSERTLQGRWCHEGMSELEILGGKQKIVMHFISFIDGNYIYQISVMSVAGRQNNPGAIKFIESFRLK